MPEWQRRVGLARADLLRLYLEAAGPGKGGENEFPLTPTLSPRGEGGNGGVGAAKRLFLRAYNTGLAYPQIFGVLGKVTYPTIERWKRAARADNPLALAPRWGEHRRGEVMEGLGVNIRSLTPEQVKIILGAALSPNRPKIAEAIRTARLIMAAQGVADGHSEATYRRFLEDFQARRWDLWVFHREGEAALDDKCLPFLEGDYSALEVGDVLVADGHTLNWETINPWTGKPKRMTLILWWDLKSSFPLGWEVDPSENTQAIAAGLRRAILRLGKVPRVAYMDNGKAFGARYFGGKNLKECGFEGLFSRLGVRPVYAWPYHAQSKPIERFFRSFGELERLAPTYTGTHIDDKPAWRRRREKIHGRLHQKITGGRIPTLEGTHRAIAWWFDRHVRRGQRGKLEGRSPLEVFEEYLTQRREDAKAQEINEVELRHLMLSVTVKTINRNGVSLRGRGHYYSEELYGRKHQAVVRYDSQDHRAVWIYGPDGEFICKAESRAQVHRMAILGTDEDRELVQEQIEQKRHLKKQTTASARKFADEVVVPETQKKLALLGWDPQAGSVGCQAPVVHLPVSPERLQAQVAEGERWLAEDRLEEAAAFWRTIQGLPDPERYERLLKLEVQGRELPPEEMAFMRYFAQTESYRALEDYYQDKRLYFTLGKEAGQQQ